MDSFVKVDRRVARLLAACLWILPLMIIVDEALWRLFPDWVIQHEILISLGLHTINLQSAIADVFLIPALILYTYYAVTR